MMNEFIQVISIVIIRPLSIRYVAAVNQIFFFLRHNNYNNNYACECLYYNAMPLIVVGKKTTETKTKFI